MKRKSTLVLLYFLFCMLAANSAALAQQFVVNSRSTLTVFTASNVNSMNCDQKKYTSRDTLEFKAPGSSNVTAINGDLRVLIKEMDCHNFIYNANMKKFLKSEKYPQLRIAFLSVQKMPALAALKEETLLTKLNIFMAGNERVYTLPLTYKISKTGNKQQMQIVGVSKMKFSAFGLTPPEYMGGLVKVNDDFTVNFTLVLDEVR